MNDNMRSFVRGLLTALPGQPVGWPGQKELVGYSYNGVVLPALPEWDREKYPYAVVKGYAMNATLMVFSVPMYVEDAVFDRIHPSKNGLYCEWSYIFSTETWNEKKIGGQMVSGEWSVTFDKGHWTNTDLYDSDGTIYLAATDPILVYE